MIYVAKAGKQYKVGYSKNPPKRMQAIQTGNGFRVHLVAVFEGGKALEASVHRYLRNYRLQGEWFQGEAVDAFISEAMQQGAIAVTLETPPLPPPTVKKHKERYQEVLPAWEEFQKFRQFYDESGIRPLRRRGRYGRRR